MSGKQGPNFFLHYVIIILFASGLVALGAQEIHDKYGNQFRFRARGKQLVEELKGDRPSSFTRVQKSPSVRTSSNAKGSINWDVVGRGEQSWVGARKAQPSAKDKLSSTDRRELDSLLSHVDNE